MSDYSDQKLYSEEEILDVLVGLDVIYQSKTWMGKLLWWPWHAALEVIAIQLTGNELQKRETLRQAEELLRKEGEDYETEL